MKELRILSVALAAVLFLNLTGCYIHSARKNYAARNEATAAKMCELFCTTKGQGIEKMKYVSYIPEGHELQTNDIPEERCRWNRGAGSMVWEEMHGQQFRLYTCDIGEDIPFVSPR